MNQEQISSVISETDSLNISKKEYDDIFQRFLLKKEYHLLLPQVFHDKHDIIVMMDSNKKLAQKIKLDIQNELDRNSKMRK